MVTYVCMGIVFLFASIRIALYYGHAKRTPEPRELEQTLFAILKQDRRDPR
ncbi:hypothetical protein [Paenibacillus sp. 1P07SE]|uniref:hypothetical protein n=1 Tax=Paenibacillus sp. 1P07SE TaxID=3132209 RepID=UPI0039A5DA16